MNENLDQPWPYPHPESVTSGGAAPVPATGSPSDAARLKHLEELFLHCPHAEIFHCDDPDMDEPIGWTMRITGCETLEITASTFVGLIDLSISIDEQERAYQDDLTDKA